MVILCYIAIRAECGGIMRNISDITRPKAEAGNCGKWQSTKRKVLPIPSLIQIYPNVQLDGNVDRKLSVEICWLCFVRASRTAMNKSSDAGRDHQPRLS